MRYVGTTSRGIRLPVIAKGDEIVRIVAESVIAASRSERDSFVIRDRDIIGITESLVARSQGNYVTLKDIADDVEAKIPEGDVAVVFPIISRNRFYQILRGIAAGVRGRVHIVLSYPSDEVGNKLIEPMNYYMKNKEVPDECFDEEEFYRVFGEYKHPFTGVDYIQLYKSVAPDKIFVHFANNPLSALKFAKNAIVASIHMRKLHKLILEKARANVLCLDEICNAPVNGTSGYNSEYGLLGSNYTSEDSVKLFPRDCMVLVKEVQKEMRSRTGKHVEVMVYGDGTFKDPVEGIWELADPVVSPGFTDGLIGLPKEIKFKYVADNAGDKDPTQAVIDAIKSKNSLDRFGMETLGTTPRKLTDLLGSLCDLTSGSGDKGTPVVYIQGYFDSYIDD